VVLTVYPRQQEQCDWCAPAVAQITSNRSHGTSGNVHAQSSIALLDGHKVMDCTVDGIPDGGTCLGYFLDTLTRCDRPAVDVDNQYRLVNWPNPSHGGHYIELHGYDGYATESGAEVVYSDTVGWCGSGTSASNWPQNSWVVHRVSWDHGYLVY
jgi:hypothetical protein